MKADVKTYPGLLAAEEIRDPHSVINDFFRMFAMDDARDIIHRWMESIYDPPNWNKESPGNLLYFYEYIIRLIEACWLLKKTDNSHRLANLTEKYHGNQTELLDTRFYCPAFFREVPWPFFPRSLSWSEYLQPYKVFRRFFQFRKLYQWKDELHELLYKAFIGRTLQPDREMVDLIGYKRYLEKLTEATHLIHVREFEWENGILHQNFAAI